MATHSSGLAWRIPGTGEPGGLPSMGSHRVGVGMAGPLASISPGGTQHRGSVAQNLAPPSSRGERLELSPTPTE